MTTALPSLTSLTDDHLLARIEPLAAEYEAEEWFGPLVVRERQPQYGSPYSDISGSAA